MELQEGGQKYKMVEFTFVSYAVLFGIAGIFICGFTLVFLAAIQHVVEILTNDCVSAMKWMWSFCLVGLAVTPVIFYKFLMSKPVHSKQTLQKQYALFNLLMYMFIQTSLGVFTSDPEILCYATDGQNGLELAFNGWLSIPFLVLIALYLKKKRIIVELS